MSNTAANVSQQSAWNWAWRRSRSDIGYVLLAILGGVIAGLIYPALAIVLAEVFYALAVCAASAVT